MPAYFDIIGDIEVEFANGDGHAGEGLTFGEVGLDGVPVFVEFMVAWVREVRPLWMEKRKVVPCAGLHGLISSRKTGTSWKWYDSL